MCCRGQELHLQYSHLSELCSFVLHANIMALTATASDTTIKHIIKDTCMINPVMVQVSPNKVNIHFGERKILSAEEYFKPLAEQLKYNVLLLIIIFASDSLIVECCTTCLKSTREKLSVIHWEVHHHILSVALPVYLLKV